MGWIKPADTAWGDTRGGGNGGSGDVACLKFAGAIAPFQNGTKSNYGAIHSGNSLAVSGRITVLVGWDGEQARHGGYLLHIEGENARGELEPTEGSARMAQKRANVRQKQATGEPCSRIPKMEQVSLPAELHPISDELLLAMHPGDIVFLDDSESLRPMVETAFFAVLSCPGCGTLGLITIPQYCGTALVVCGSDCCSCQFRILEKSRLQYLPAS